MAKASQLEKALANLKGERDVLDLAIRKLEAQQTTQGDKDRRAAKRSIRKSLDVVGTTGGKATTEVEK